MWNKGHTGHTSVWICLPEGHSAGPEPAGQEALSVPLNVTSYQSFLSSHPQLLARCERRWSICQRLPAHLNRWLQTSFRNIQLQNPFAADK